jgi:hypothetical protein
MRGRAMMEPKSIRHYLFAGGIGVLLGGVTLAILTKAIPKMMTRMMSEMMGNMMSQLGDDGCQPVDI